MSGKSSERDLALQVLLDGVQLIEASAGTGKTYTIAGLYVRLLVERALEVDRILVMTFTKAATEELRQRLRDRLRLCARMAREPWLAGDDEPPADLAHEAAWSAALLRRALHSGGESPGELARRLEQALTRMDQAAIFTIHGFCQRVIGEHAALIEGVDQGAVLEPSDDDLLEAFATDAWLRMGEGGDALRREALMAFGDSPQKLSRCLRELVSFDGRIEPLADGSPQASDVPDVDAALRDLRAIWETQGNAASEVFRQVFDAGHLNGRSYRADSPDLLARLRRELAGGGQPSASLLAKFAGSRLKASMKKHAPDFPDHAAFDAIDEVLACEQAFLDAVRARVPVVLQRLVAEARTWLAARKQDLARMSYTDQIAWVHRGLGPDSRGERLARALRQQYPVALVDEFQDTDARQYAILERLYGETGTLFCIGDPKQAIYGFRGGDVHAYLRAARRAGKSSSLRRNFRSSLGCIGACNALFAQRGDVFVEPGIGFTPAETGGRVADGKLHLGTDPVAPMTLWRLPDSLPEGGKDAALSLMAASCAETIVQLLVPGAASLDGYPLQPGSLAVLVDTNDQAMRMQDALAVRGVPAVCQRRESVFASEEAMELCRILDALLAPRHAGYARAALCTRLLGRRLGDIAAMAEDRTQWREELDDLRQCWNERGILALLERLGERHARRLLAQDRGERRLSNLMQLGDALQAEARRLSGLRAQRDWLARRIELADEHNEEEQLRLESDAERVQILTIHASKGLEYDLVFLPFTAWMQASQQGKGKFARFHDGDDLVKRYLATGKDDRDPGDLAAQLAAQREDLAEGVRKLYVGVTRARHACWMSIGARHAPDKGFVLDHVLPDDLSAMIESAAGAIREQELPATSPLRLEAARPAAVLTARRFTRSLDRDWRRHSFTRLADGGHASGFEPVPDSLPASGPVVPALPSGLRGSRFGSAVHDILEHIDFAAWRGGAATLTDVQRDVVSRALAAQGIAGATAQRAVEGLVARTLRTPVVDALCLADLAPAARRAEMAFDFGIAGIDPRAWLDGMHAHGYQTGRQSFAHIGTRLAGLMNGLIDLVFVHEGRWWIVDYKTNHLGDRVTDYAPDALQRAVRDSDYDLQYLIYTVALHRWLGQVRGDAYDYARDFGGVRYLFLRGMGVGPSGNGIFVDRPAPELVRELDHLLHAPGVAT